MVLVGAIAVVAVASSVGARGAGVATGEGEGEGETRSRDAVRGAVGDASCDVEDVEGANEAQLHSILSELTNTTYFRLFQVD